MPNTVINRRLLAASKRKGSSLLSGLRAYWQLDGSTTGAGFVWVDATGNGFGAVQHAGNMQSDHVRFLLGGGSAKEGAGGNDGAAASASIDTRAPTTPFTASFWIFDTGNSFADNPIANDDITNRNWSCYMGDASGGNTGANFVSLQTWRTTTGTYDGAITAPSACHTNVSWDHVVAGYDGTNRFLVFNNGVRVTSAVVSVGRGSAALTLMSRGDFLANFVGNLDEVGYWNRALTAAEITRLYNGGAGLAFANF